MAAEPPQKVMEWMEGKEEELQKVMKWMKGKEEKIEEFIMKPLHSGSAANIKEIEDQIKFDSLVEQHVKKIYGWKAKYGLGVSKAEGERRRQKAMEYALQALENIGITFESLHAARDHRKRLANLGKEAGGEEPSEESDQEKRAAYELAYASAIAGAPAPAEMLATCVPWLSAQEQVRAKASHKRLQVAARQLARHPAIVAAAFPSKAAEGGYKKTRKSSKKRHGGKRRTRKVKRSNKPKKKHPKKTPKKTPQKTSQKKP